MVSEPEPTSEPSPDSDPPTTVRRPRIERSHPLQVEAYRRMTSAQRIEAALSIADMLRELVSGHVRSLHPDWDEEQVRTAVAARFLGSRPPTSGNV